MPPASFRQFGAEFFEVREIRFAQQHRVEQVFVALLFETLELRPALEWELQFVAVPDLEDEDFVMRVTEMRERFEQLVHVAEEIRNHDEQSAPVQIRHEVVEDIANLRLAAGLAFLQLIHDDAEMADAGARRDVFADLRVEGDEAHAVLLADHQIREASGEARGVFVFRDAVSPVIHRAAEIEQQRGAEVRFLLVFADVKAVAAPEDAPVNVPDFIAGDVLAMLLKLDAESLVRRAMQAGAKALDDLARDDLEVADLLQIGGGEEVGDVGHGSLWKRNVCPGGEGAARG